MLRMGYIDDVEWVRTNPKQTSNRSILCDYAQAIQRRGINKVEQSTDTSV